MKQKILFFLLILLITSSVCIYADTSEFFVQSLFITRVYPHRLGYRIVYQRTDNQYDEFYIPRGWFQEAAGRGEMIFGTDDAYPFFSVFYRNGEFHHIRIYVRDNYNHPTWGTLEAPRTYDQYFQDVETLEIEY
ncbi:MAG: hypothetical protein ACLFR1_14030 [Spirochaetia bacterium]